MAVIAFEGTSTKKIYKVGTLVQGTGGRVLKVNADGSFTDTKSGKVSVGSSQSKTAKFYSSVASGGRSATAKTTGSPKVSAATAVVASAPYVGSGAGVGTVLPPGPPVRASAGAIAPNITPLYWGGQRLQAATGWSDGDQFETRWGEWGGAIGGLAVMGADIAENVFTDKFFEDLDGAPSAIADGIVDFARYLDQKRAANAAKAPSYADTFGFGSTIGNRTGVPKYRTGGGF